MTRRTKDTPDIIHDAAESSWGKWRDSIPVTPRMVNPEALRMHTRSVDPDAGKSHEQRIIEKIRRRMKEYPEWYETRPEAVAEEVKAELDRIGAILARDMPLREDAVEVWQIPLSVFNWLEDGPQGEVFHRGALLAWSSAEKFNAANAPELDPAKRAHLRQPFFEIAPLLLRAVLEELLETGLWISFAEKFVGSELEFLVLRVQRPI